MDAPADAADGPQRPGQQKQHQGQTELDELLVEQQGGAEGLNWKQQMWHGFVDSSKQVGAGG
jgi:hypothetical protein